MEVHLQREKRDKQSVGCQPEPRDSLYSPSGQRLRRKEGGHTHETIAKDIHSIQKPNDGTNRNTSIAAVGPCEIRGAFPFGLRAPVILLQKESETDKLEASRPSGRKLVSLLTGEHESVAEVFQDRKPIAKGGET